MRYIFTYDVNGNKILCKDDFSQVLTPVYDDIVDRSQFRPDSENVRNLALAGSGAGSIGSFDDPQHMPSDLEVKIRSGKFDKAEVGIIMKNRIDEFNNENDAKAKADKKKEIEAISEARQAFLDAKTGFTGLPQSPVEQ